MKKGLVKIFVSLLMLMIVYSTIMVVYFSITKFKHEITGMNLWMLVVIISVTIVMANHSIATFFPETRKKNWRWIQENKLSFFFYSLLLWAFFLLLIDIFSEKIYESDFWENVLIEAHGVVFDLILFGVIFTIYERFYEKHLENKRLKEEINDLREWEDPEAMYRNVGNIGRLVKNGVTQIDLTDCHLSSSKLMNLNLSKSTLLRTKLQSSKLRNIILDDAKIENSFFNSAKFSNVSFKNATLNTVSFEDTVLHKTSFEGAYLFRCSFKDAQFTMDTVLEGAYVSDLEWMSKIKSESKHSSVFSAYVVNKKEIKDKNGNVWYKIVKK